MVVVAGSIDVAAVGASMPRRNRVSGPIEVVRMVMRPMTDREADSPDAEMSPPDPRGCLSSRHRRGQSAESYGTQSHQNGVVSCAFGSHGLSLLGPSNGLRFIEQVEDRSRAGRRSSQCSISRGMPGRQTAGFIEFSGASVVRAVTSRGRSRRGVDRFGLG